MGGRQPAHASCVLGTFFKERKIKIACNPPIDKIKSLIHESKYKAAKWIKDVKTNETWYWSAENFNHSDIAEQLGISEYTKGISIQEETHIDE